MIVKGAASRHKSFFIEGICAEEVEKKLGLGERIIGDPN